MSLSQRVVVYNPKIGCKCSQYRKKPKYDHHQFQILAQPSGTIENSKFFPGCPYYFSINTLLMEKARCLQIEDHLESHTCSFLRKSPYQFIYLWLFNTKKSLSLNAQKPHRPKPIRFCPYSNIHSHHAIALCAASCTLCTSICPVLASRSYFSSLFPTFSG